jgi:L-ornithine N5-oxygenase
MMAQAGTGDDEAAAYDLFGIGFGPSNLALAIAASEPGTAVRVGFAERQPAFGWHRGMLLDDATMQVSFLKDLVTLRNPRSRFSFVNYLHSVGRLSEFINLGDFWPYRSEISDYFRWVADSLSLVRVEYGRRCAAVEPRRDATGAVTGWLTRLADGSTISSRFLVLGVGREPNVPVELAGLPPGRVVHSSQYVQRIAELAPSGPRRVAVLGGAQSAAEMFDAVQRDLPGCRATLVMHSIGPRTYENSKFTNELYFPAATDAFFAAGPEARGQILREMHLTNYSALAPEMLDRLYRQLYLDRLAGRDRLRVLTMTDVVGGWEDRDGAVLKLADRRSGTTDLLHCDLVLLGTGFRREMPALVRELAAALGLDEVEVTRDYRLRLDGPASAACYLQGVNEATHGIADSLLSVLAPRAAEITADLLARRAGAVAADAPAGAAERPRPVPTLAPAP